jgi:hypothetical protein
MHRLEVCNVCIVCRVRSAIYLAQQTENFEAEGSNCSIKSVVGIKINQLGPLSFGYL